MKWNIKISLRHSDIEVIEESTSAERNESIGYEEVK